MNAKITIQRKRCYDNNWIDIIMLIGEMQQYAPNGILITLNSSMLAKLLVVEINYEIEHYKYLQMWIKSARKSVIKHADIKISKLEKENRFTPAFFKQKVAEFYGVSTFDLDLKTTNREIIRFRQIAHYLSRNYTVCSLAKIGNIIGNVPHDAVIYSCKTISNLLETNIKFRNEIKPLLNI